MAQQSPLVDQMPLPPRLLSLEEIAAILGIHQRTAWKWYSQGMPRVFGAGKIVRFDYAEVINWLKIRGNQSGHRPPPPISSKASAYGRAVLAATRPRRTPPQP